MPTRKESFVLAIKAEIMSQNLYTMLAASFKKRPEVSAVFLNLVPMEKIHEDKIRAMFEQEFPDSVISIDTELSHKVKPEDIVDPEKVLEFAISREEAAHQLYTNMADESSDPAAAKLLKSFAEEEENHKIVLQTEILRLEHLMTWFDPSELNGLVED
jgi:rubrerythrin